jgi:hypothetical protein
VTYTNYAVCKSCFSVHNYDSKKGNSSLNSHKCPTDKAGPGQMKLTLCSDTPRTSDVRKVTLPESTKQNLNESAIMVCAMDMRPLSVFEGQGMVAFCQRLVDSAAEIGRFDFKSTIVHPSNLSRTYLPAVYDRQRALIKDEMLKVESMGHTTDCWQEKYQGTNYISLTCLYITQEFEWRNIIWRTERFDVPTKNADAIRKWYLESIQEMGLENNRHFPVADNASTMASVFRNHKGLGCSAHCINLVVNAMTSSDDAPEALELF